MLFTKMAPNAWRALVAVLLAAGYAALASSATTHTVGGVHSWMTGVDYAAWASDKTFVVGDQLCEQSPDDYIRHSYVCCCVCCRLQLITHDPLLLAKGLINCAGETVRISTCPQCSAT